MDKIENKPRLLGGYRVLDLTDEKGLLCGRALGDLGADVIKIEKPGGDSARYIGPFYKDIEDPEKSLYWFFYNLNKRSVTLDIKRGEGQEILKKLVKKADFVIESFPPGYLGKLGVGCADLSRVNPGLIVTSITPFGQGGPRKDYQISDLVAEALGGLLYISGDPDRCPVRITYPQAFAHASVEASAATMIAHYHRTRTGQGQFVDVSIEHSMVLTTILAVPIWQVTHVNMKRSGANPGLARMLWPCKDGFVMFQVFGSALGGRSNRALAQWMESEGAGDSSFSSIDWDPFDMHMTNATKEELERINRVLEPIGKFFQSRTKAELYGGAVKRSMMLHPVSTTRDVREDAQLKARDYWVEVEHPELGTRITYPGGFIKASETPLVLERRAPLIGEHNAEVYGEIGLSGKEILALKQRGVI